MSIAIQPKIEVCLSPALLNLYDLEDKVVVIIDVFRATSTMVTALYNGATTIIPVKEVDECIAIGATIPDSITAGERDGQIAPGLTYGNSPSSFPRSFIEGKTLVLTTTNGTKLLHQTHQAAHQVIGSFLNLSAVCEFLIATGKSVVLGCAAWKDRVNMEDALFAGAVIDKVSAHFEIACDSGRMTRAMYQDALQHSDTLIDYLKQSTHYKRLAQYGLEEDMAYCAQVDVHPIVPLYVGDRLVYATS